LIAVAVRPSKARLYALLSLMLLFWSANFIFAKIAVREMPALMAVCLRTLFAGLFMWPVYFFAQERMDAGMRKWSATDAPALLALGILGVLGNQALFVIGISRTSVAHGSVITAMGPIFVLLGATLTGIERLTFRKTAGMLVAACGVAVLQLGRTHTGGATLAGDLILIVATMAFACFTVFGKGVVLQFGAITVNTFAFVGGALLMLPLTFWEFAHSNMARVSSLAWMGVLYMALFPSIAGYLIYSHALRYLPATRVSSVSYFQPVVATLLAVFFLGEHPGLAFAGGAALVLGGVYVTERR
jgi:drug/metabolite transporter (DMT)-like permease